MSIFGSFDSEVLHSPLCRECGIHAGQPMVDPETGKSIKFTGTDCPCIEDIDEACNACREMNRNRLPRAEPEWAEPVEQDDPDEQDDSDEEDTDEGVDCVRPPWWPDKAEPLPRFDAGSWLPLPEQPAVPDHSAVAPPLLPPPPRLPAPAPAEPVTAPRRPGLVRRAWERLLTVAKARHGARWDR
ncbi:hypothetical protein [Frankia sp. AvcI1]|uniref:hypothetical protein n=1 Tax=Frankia sp. AvcI1 TaxID=573496 RepID=UPI0021193095|nr:hypothetical protein [Frankia sp. AvcI1]